MPAKQFKAPRDKRPPLEFEITYEKDIDGEFVEQTAKFRARPSIPGALLLQIASAMDAGIGIQSVELIRLFNGAIWPDDRRAFNDMINDEDVAVPIETLGEILEWLAEEYAERPTQSV
jgi:hypothetical protein